MIAFKIVFITKLNVKSFIQILLHSSQTSNQIGLDFFRTLFDAKIKNSIIEALSSICRIELILIEA